MAIEKKMGGVGVPLYVCVFVNLCLCMVYVYSSTKIMKTGELSNIYKLKSSSDFINTGLVQMLSASKQFVKINQCQNITKQLLQYRKVAVYTHLLRAPMWAGKSAVCKNEKYSKRQIMCQNGWTSL